MSLTDKEIYRNGTDLTIPLLVDAQEHDVVVPNGAHAGGWHVYASPNGGSWVADEDKAWEGAAQTGHVLHIRTADNDGNVGKYSQWHRSYFKTQFARPTVYCSFRIDDHDESRSSIGFKLAYLHQDNMNSYYVMFMLDGRVVLYKEGRDSIDAAGSGFTVAIGRWEYKPGVRRHVVVQQSKDGTIKVLLDGMLVVKGRDSKPFMSGQIGLRLDGLDCRIHSLVVLPPEYWDIEEEAEALSPWAASIWNWATDNGLVNQYTKPREKVEKEELMVFFKRFHDKFIK